MYCILNKRILSFLNIQISMVFLGILAGFFFTTTHALYIYMYMCHWNKVHNHLFAGIRLLWHLQTFWWIHKLGACSKSLPSKISICTEITFWDLKEGIYFVWWQKFSRSVSHMNHLPYTLKLYMFVHVEMPRDVLTAHKTDSSL